METPFSKVTEGLFESADALKKVSNMAMATAKSHAKNMVKNRTTSQKLSQARQESGHKLRQNQQKPKPKGMSGGNALGRSNMAKFTPVSEDSNNLPVITFENEKDYHDIAKHAKNAFLPVEFMEEDFSFKITQPDMFEQISNALSKYGKPFSVSYLNEENSDDEDDEDTKKLDESEITRLQELMKFRNPVFEKK